MIKIYLMKQFSSSQSSFTLHELDVFISEYSLERNKQTNRQTIEEAGNGYRKISQVNHDETNKVLYFNNSQGTSQLIP